MYCLMEFVGLKTEETARLLKRKCHGSALHAKKLINSLKIEDTERVKVISAEHMVREELLKYATTNTKTDTSIDETWADDKAGL